MRLFIAINFDKKTRDNISSIQSNLKNYSKGSYTHPANIHLTLVFLGEISPEKIENVKQAMSQISLSQINIIFNHVGFFKRNDGDIWWIGLEKNEKLFILQKNLVSALIEYGFNVDRHTFCPHITLGRGIRLSKEVDRSIFMNTPFDTKINSISLMRSERINGRLTYTELYKQP